MDLNSIIKNLQSNDPKKKKKAAEALYEIGARAQNAIPILIKNLKDDDEEIRYLAVATLGKLGPRAKLATVPLGQVLENTRESKEVRSLAASALGLIGPASLPVIKQGLQRNDILARRYLMTSLAYLAVHRNEDSTPVDLIIECLGDGDRDVRLGSFEALGRYKEHANLSAIKGLEHKNGFVRIGCAHFLVRSKSDSKAATEVILKEIYNGIPEIRMAAAQAIGETPLDRKKVAEKLTDLLEDKSRAVRCVAILEIGKIGLGAKIAVPFLINNMKEADDEVRASAALALGKIGKEARSAVPELIAALKDKHADVVLNSIYSLGEIGEAARNAEPALRKLLNHPDFGDDARVALERIGADSK